MERKGKNRQKNRGENAWGKQYQDAGMRYFAVLRQIVNENPCEGIRSLYLIKPL